MPDVLPELTHTGQRLYDALAPLAESDEQYDYALAVYCGAWATVLDQVADLSRDTDDGPGWGVVLDPDTTPFVAWLSQFPGVQIPQGLADAQAREWLRATDGRNRGTPAAIEGAAKPYLTGTKTVYLSERAGSAYRYNVATKTSETPDEASVASALMAQKPAGLVMNYGAVSGNDYETAFLTHCTYAQTKGIYGSYAAALADPAKQ